MNGITCDALTVLCSNTFERTYYDFRYQNSSMEACIDYGEIKDSNGRPCDLICEIELELKKGTIEDLEDAKIRIVDGFGAVPFDETKLARTLRASKSGGSV